MSTLKDGFRVYITQHHDGRLTGLMMRSKENWIDTPAPSAYGETEESVLDQLEAKMFEEIALGRETGRYLWDESFQTRRVPLEVHSETMLDTVPVVGSRVTPLRMWFAWSRHESGAYRVMLPRYGWWLLFEDLEDVPAILKSLIAGSLTGQNPSWLFEFREQGEERVLAWRPEKLLSRLPDESSSRAEAEPEELSKVGEEWVARAKRKKLALVVGEDPHSAKLAHLIKRGPSPVLLVGDPGVGKTAIVRRVAKLLVREKGAPRLWATSAERILAGQVYLGMWQERCLKLTKELSEEGDWLFVERLSTFARPMSDGSSLAEALSAAILGREVGFIAECTRSELVQVRRSLSSLVDACQIIDVKPTSPTQMLELMQIYQLRKRATSVLNPAALTRAVEYLDRYVRASRFPGKGFAFLDWVAQQASDRPTAVDPYRVTSFFSEYSGLPSKIIEDETSLSRDDIEQELAAQVIGQPEACRVSAEVLARFKAGMTDPQRPLGSLFFVGPTGVGKTELAKQLARFTFGDEKRLLRLDMAEYGHRGSAARLLQVGDGVSSLASRLSGQPLSVVLLDEIEKAHPEVFDLLLGVLGEGRITDLDGRLVDARSTLFIMTSNLGAGESRSVGFGDSKPASFERAVRDHFRPEFFNRIDHVVSFRHLTKDDVTKIVELELARVRSRPGLKRHGVQLLIEPQVRAWLAERGYHPSWGARPLRRLIEETIVAKVAVYLAENPQGRSDRLLIRLVDDVPRLDA